MKLHNVVELRQALESILPVSNVEREIDDIIDNIALIKTKYGEDYSFRLEQLIGSLESIKRDLAKPLAQLADIKEITDLDLQDATEKFYRPGYQDELRYANPDRIREIRTMYFPTGVEEIVRRSIDLYVSWQYPGLEIGCRDGEWTKHIVGCDPLYITDTFPEFLESTVKNYPSEYQNRLRKYLIKDHSLSQLPVGQFGFIFSWNYFNYLSMPIIERYLKQIITLLRPGGALMFSYNNAEMPASASYADSYFMSYATKTQILDMCEKIGFELITSIDLEPAISWIEIKRPGKLKLIKAHQVLGEIKYANP